MKYPKVDMSNELPVVFPLDLKSAIEEMRERNAELDWPNRVWGCDPDLFRGNCIS